MRVAPRSSFAPLPAALLVSTTLALGSLVPSCAAGPRSLRWRIELATSALRTRTEAVVARVLDGGCEGETIYDARLEPAGSMALAPPLLAPGRYGLAAFAIDDACALVAADCREVALPTEGEITLLLHDGADAPRCPSDICPARGCTATDAGPRDGGGFDATTPDAARADAGPDAGPLDTGPLDTGPVDGGPRDASLRDAGTDAAVCTTTTPRVVGSFVSSPWFSRVDATGGAITFSTSAGAMGSLTLSGGASATGTAVASELCTSTCTPLSFRGVTASGHTLTFRDWMDVESTITLVGTTATGGLELSSSDGYLVSVTAGMRMMTFSNGATPAITGTIMLTPDTTCE